MTLYLGRLAGKKIRIAQVSIDEYADQPQVRANLNYGQSYGEGIDWPRHWATAFEAIRQGETDVVMSLRTYATFPIESRKPLRQPSGNCTNEESRVSRYKYPAPSRKAFKCRSGRSRHGFRVSTRNPLQSAWSLPYRGLIVFIYL